MAFPTIKYDLGSRSPLLDFIIWEEITPNGHSRAALGTRQSPVQVAAGVRIGDPVTAAGAAANVDGTDFYGLSLVELAPTLGVHTNGDVGASVIFRDAEVKDNAKYTAAIKAKMTAAGIDVLVTGL